MKSDLAIVTIHCGILRSLIDTVESVNLYRRTDNETLLHIQCCPKRYNEVSGYFAIAPAGVTLSRENDTGISSAFNFALKHADAEWVMFLNSGDVLIERPPDVSELDYDVIYCSSIIQESFKGPFIVRQSIVARLNRYMSVNHPGMLVSKKVLQEVGFFDESFKIAMDYEWILRAKNQFGIKIHSRPSTMIKMEPGGISSANFYRAAWEVFRVRIRYLGFGACLLGFTWDTAKAVVKAGLLTWRRY